jgi:hypothetical protein
VLVWQASVCTLACLLGDDRRTDNCAQDVDGSFSMPWPCIHTFYTPTWYARGCAYRSRMCLFTFLVVSCWRVVLKGWVVAGSQRWLSLVMEKHLLAVGLTTSRLHHCSMHCVLCSWVSGGCVVFVVLHTPNPNSRNVELRHAFIFEVSHRQRQYLHRSHEVRCLQSSTQSYSTCIGGVMPAHDKPQWMPAEDLYTPQHGGMMWALTSMGRTLARWLVIP